MPNNQAHDPRVATAGERVAQAVVLSVAASASGGGAASGGTAVLAYSAPEGIADGNNITLTTDGSGGWDFGTGPSELATLGFGQGLLYTAALGPNLQDHVDPLSGVTWDWERNLDPTREIVEDSGIRALKMPDGNGGFLTWVFGSQIPENGKLFISTLSKSNYGFVNSISGTAVEVASVSDTEVTLVSPWPHSSYTGSGVMFGADPQDETLGKFQTSGTFTNGSATIAITGASPLANGVQAGWFVGQRALSQWKGVRVSDTGGFGSGTSPEGNDFYETPNNSTESGYQPTSNRWTSLPGGSIYGFPGSMWLKNWSRADHQLSYGALGSSNGKISGNLIAPSESYAGYNLNETTGLSLHNADRRTGAISWQDFTVGVTNPNLFRTDFFAQTNSFARFELANSDDPSTTTESYILPPILAEWTAGAVKVRLWKSLFANYTGKYVQFFDASGVFRGAVAL